MKAAFISGCKTACLIARSMVLPRVLKLFAQLLDDVAEGSCVPEDSQASYIPPQMRHEEECHARSPADLSELTPLNTV